MRQGRRTTEQSQHQRNKVEFFKGCTVNLEFQTRSHDFIAWGNNRVVDFNIVTVFIGKISRFPPLDLGVLVTQQSQESRDGQLGMYGFFTGFAGDLGQTPHLADNVFL